MIQVGDYFFWGERPSKIIKLDDTFATVIEINDVLERGSWYINLYWFNHNQYIAFKSNNLTKLIFGDFS